jgi:predicted DNA-binding helix-hairpin-helix protein
MSIFQLIFNFVLDGGSDESDLELLSTTDWLMKNVRLTRAYYPAFQPIRDTSLENKPAVDPIREHRLYEASFLLFYIDALNDKTDLSSGV